MEVLAHRTIATTTPCLHCGTAFTPKAQEDFCCTGCEFVHGLLHKEGLGEYYSLRDANPPACPIPVQPSTETFDYCDDPTFISKSSTDGRHMEFYLEGLNCTACLWLLERLPQFCASAEHARVNMANSTIDVMRAEGGSFADIARALNRFGYRPHPIQDKASNEALKKKENRRDLIRIGIAGGAMGNIMMLAVPLYGGAEGSIGGYFRWAMAAIAIPSMTYCAWPFYKSAINAVRMGRLNIDVPVVAALWAGILISIWGLFAGVDTVYFDSLAMLVFLMNSSRFWLKRIQQHHLDVSHLEDFLLVGTVNRVDVETGRMEKVSSLSLTKGDVVEISGESVIPADGVIVQGEGVVQTAVLTGEAAPLTLAKGDRVEAGTRNLSGTWLFRVENAGAESRLAQILKDAERSTKEKPSLVLFADKVSQWFIIVVFAAAIAVALWFAATNPVEGLSRALALVIVSCPCVFGVAIPLSMSLAIRGAAKRGMIIKNADVVERLAKIRTLFFDKTGTLTKGDLRVLKLDIVPGMQDHLAAAISLEEDQPHPVARAIIRALDDRGLPRKKAENARLLPEGGIEGEIGGVPYSIRPLGEAALGKHSPKADVSQVKARYALFCGTQAAAFFEIGDELRDDARGVVSWARDHELKTVVLSGDKQAVVEMCGQQLGLSAEEMIAGATPEKKSSVLKSCGEQALMIGDGANDAAALASASVGVAVRGSMDVSLRAADVYLTRTDLKAVPALFEIARLTRGAIVRNLVFSASFNAVSGLLALFGLMSPLLAAILMPLSSLTVLASALVTGRRIERPADEQGGEKGAN